MSMLTRRPSGRLCFYRCGWMLSLALSAGSIAGADATHADEIPPLPNWIPLYGIRTGIGYKENVLLSSMNPRDSAFLTAGGDYMLVRTPGSGLDTQLFLSADRVHYLATDVPENEHTIVALARTSGKIGQSTLGITGQYLFQDQVLDVSATETDIATVQVKLHDFALKPSLRYGLPLGWFIEAEPVGRRQEVAEPLDDIWEGGVKGSVGREYGFRSRANVALEVIERFYDERTQRARTGAALPDTSLQFSRITIEAGAQHHWDEKRQWRTQLRLGYLMNEDNGPGYFNYDRAFVQLQVRYKRAAWEIRGQVRFDHYLFEHQLVSAADRDRRSESETGIGARVERQFSKTTRVFLQFDRTISRSSRSLDEYDTLSASAGSQWEF